MSKILKSFGLAALLVALLAGTGMAGTDDTTAVSGTVDLTYTITSPETVGFGSFVEGDNNVTTGGAGPANLTVTCNGAVNLQAAGTNAGKMRIGESGDTLTNEMWLTADPGKVSEGTPVELSGSAQTVKAVAKGTSTDVGMDFGQLVLATDTAGNYAITVTFSAVSQ